MTAPLQIKRDGPLTELVLNRPDKANALNAELIEALLEALQTASSDATRLLVMRGEGKVFCGGFDFSGLDVQSEGDLVLRFIRIEQLLQAVHHAPVATMVLCQGAAYGAGADLVSSCDHRIATPGARFRMPGLRFGIALGTRRLAECIGSAAADRVLSESRTFDADEARQMGLLTAVAPVTEWDAAVARALKGETLDGPAKARLKACIKQDMRALDMAALVASASVPGLKARIKAFRSEA
jgi:enoyl-CoA hydratase